jgi:predicted ester cyclase
MGDDRAELHAFYPRYLQRCNEHRFSELAEFVADDVEVNDAAMGLAGYGDGLRTVVDTFPDFHWSSATSWSRTVG